MGGALWSAATWVLRAMNVYCLLIVDWWTEEEGKFPTQRRKDAKSAKKKLKNEFLRVLRVLRVFAPLRWMFYFGPSILDVLLELQKLNCY